MLKRVWLFHLFLLSVLVLLVVFHSLLNILLVSGDITQGYYMHFEYKFDTSKIQAQFRRLQEVAQTDGLTRKIANVLMAEAEDAFDNERTPSGEKWEALDPRTLAVRERKGYTGSILQRHGDLVTSLNIDYGDSFAVIGAAEPYGQYHMTGTEDMPARPFLGLSDVGVAEIQDIIQKRLKAVFGDNG